MCNARIGARTLLQQRLTGLTGALERGGSSSGAGAAGLGSADVE